MSNGQRKGIKSLGQVYTPEILAQRVIDLVVTDGIESLKILDPSVGQGIFLSLTLQKLLDFNYPDPVQSLHGFEIDADNYQLAINHLQDIHPSKHWDEQITKVDFLSIEPEPVFNLAIGNPPWVSYSGRQAQVKPSGYKSVGWSSLHSIFIVRTIDWLIDEGKFAYILPYSIAYQEGYGALRELLRENGEVELIHPLGEKAFLGVVEPAMILVWRKSVSRSEAASTAPFETQKSINSITAGILRKVLRYSKIQFSDPGVHTGNSAKHILVNHTDGMWPWETIRLGRDIEPYCAKNPSNAIDIEKKLPKGHYARIGSLTSYKNVPIILRQTANRPIASVHTTPGYFRNSVLACHGIPLHNPHYTTALLNSPLIAFLTRHLSPDCRQKTFPQIKISVLKKLPFRECKIVYDDRNKQIIQTGLRLANEYLNHMRRGDNKP